MLTALALASLLIGCGPDRDGDGDGFLRAEDCDDRDAAIHPDADELCDGIDNDCNGAIDDSPTDGVRYFTDADGDGYGSGDAVRLCDEPGSSWVTTNTDCDDTSTAAFPGAAEVCDGIDNNCDGQVDNGAPLSTFYVDSDNDGYGNPSESVEGCEAPFGYVDNGDDCDDSDASRSPETRWYPDADGDGHGSLEEYVESCTTPNGLDVDHVRIGTDCDDTDASIFTGAVAEDYTACMLDDDNDGFGSMSPPDNINAGTDCDDTNRWTHPGAAAEDPTACMRDDDGDGYGSASPPEGVDAGTDCDDGNDDTHPGNSTEDPTACTQDLDGDGFADSNPPDGIDAGTDCDDSDASIYPGNTAEDPTACMQDRDGDGFGSASPESSSVDAGTDCDDTNGTVHPDGIEICNLRDDDCNGTTDDSYAVDASTWYTDSDGDDFGDATSSTTACEQPAGHVPNSTDCDDTDDTISPAMLEECTDGVDNNCDGATDDICMVGTDDADVTLTGSSPDDRLGSFGLNTSGDLTGDGTPDLTVGAYGASIGDLGMVYVLAGPLTSGTSLSADTASTAADLTGSSSYHYMGVTLDVGDIDGDGYDDLVTGAHGAESGTVRDTGGVFVFYGPLSGSISAADADLSFWGDDLGDQYGRRVVKAYDYDSDGAAEVIAGSYYAHVSAGMSLGVIGIHSNGADGDTYSDAEVAFIGDSTRSQVGYSLDGPGDLDGDGLNDLLIGAHGANEAYVLYGHTTGVFTPSDADITFTGSSGSDVGTLMGSGDFNSDGTADVLLGASEDSSSGAGHVYVFYGPLSSGSYSAATDHSAVITGDGVGERLGRHDPASDAGDVDSDGSDDLLLGSSFNSTVRTSGGATLLFYGPISGSRSSSDADLFIAGDALDDLGTAVSLGDLSGDGTLDITTSSHRHGGNTGQTYTFFNGSSF